jgi:serine/threonine-protein kinase
MSAPVERLRAALEGRYRVEKELGAGGMATVYLAHDLRHERDVAIKVLHPDLGAVLGAERFLSEIKTTARLQHPHILQLLDSGAADGLLYYVMPYVKGETLRARLEREGRLAIADALRIVSALSDALAYAHDEGFLHRDLKPENVLLSGAHALLADFGIAASWRRPERERLTQTGLSLGTPHYMSPEQATGERELTPASDIYALGTILFELLTGATPFTGATFEALIVQRVVKEAPRARVQRPEIPRVVDEAIAKALMREPDHRFETAQAFANTLVTPVATLERTKRIAVLPFANLSADAEHGYFADGLTEEITLTLSKVKTLHVVSRTSAAQYRERTASVPEIGRALDASYLLEGSVRKGGERLRVTATLLDAAQDVTMWTERFDGTLADVFDMQDRVAEAIVAALTIQLTADESAAVRAHPVRSPVAYDLYLRAKAGINSFTATGWHSAIEQLEAAKAMEPGNLELLRLEGRAAWAAVNHGITADRSSLDRALQIASDIERIDAMSPYVAELRGLVYTAQGNLELSIRNLATAYEALPDDSDVAIWYFASLTLGGQGRIGIPLMMELAQRDPTVAMAAIVPFFGALALGGYTDALAQLDPIVPISERSITYLAKAIACVAAGDQATAIRSLHQALTGEQNAFTELARFFLAALEGDADAFRHVSDDTRTIFWSDANAAEWIAHGHAVTRNATEAGRWLSRAAEIGLGYVETVRSHSLAWKPLLNDPAVASAVDQLAANAQRYAMIPVAPTALQRHAQLTRGEVP